MPPQLDEYTRFQIKKIMLISISFHLDYLNRDYLFDLEKNRQTIEIVKERVANMM